jgi:hypothetical protein
MSGILARVVPAVMLVAAGAAVGVALVPSPTVQQRQALASVQRCTDVLELTLHFAEDAIDQMREHIEGEIGPLPEGVDDMLEDAAEYRSTIAQGGQ